MAKQIITTISDDLDGSDADETVSFALDGWTYEIDLSKANAEKLREMMSPLVGAGRRVSGAVGRTPTPAAVHRPAKSQDDIEQRRRIRDWARLAGFTVATTGSIKAEIVDKYHQAKAAEADLADKVAAAQAPKPPAPARPTDVPPLILPALSTEERQAAVNLPSPFNGAQAVAP